VKRKVLQTRKINVDKTNEFKPSGCCRCGWKQTGQTKI